jgi:hypothetical protein
MNGAADTAGKATRNRAEKWLWGSLIAGLILAFLLLNYARSNWLIKLEEAAYGADTSGFVATLGGQVQCASAKDSAACIDAWKKAGSPQSILWLGNSQLAAINRAKAGDVNAPLLLHKALTPRGSYVVTYAVPNANLTEHALTIEAVAPIFKPRAIILPVVFDDFREQGIRAEVSDFAGDAAVRDRLKASPYRDEIEPLLAAAPQAEAAQETDTPIDDTMQSRVETWLIGNLEANSDLWAKRTGFRGMLAFSIHTLRNKLLGIHSYSKRAVEPGVFTRRMALIETIAARAKAQGVKLILYIPPYRRDIDGPYVEADYARMKAGMRAIAAKHGAGFADLEATVPGPEWGIVTDSLFGFQEPDFMHFTASGHARLAAAIDAELKAAGY